MEIKVEEAAAMNIQHETEGVPEICERIPDVILRQLPTFSTAYLRSFGRGILIQLAIGIWLAFDKEMNWITWVLVASVVGLFVVGISMTLATMRPFLRSTNQGREIRVEGGVLTIVDADGTKSNCPLTECCWAEIRSLNKSIGNHSLPDLTCLFIAMRFEKQRYNLETFRTFFAGTSMVICGLTEESRRAWNQILKANHATYRGAV